MNKDTLHAWIYALTGVFIPRYAVCPGHCAPYDYFYETFTDQVTKSIAHSCRSGGKSFLTGLYQWLKSCSYPGFTANTLAGSFDQAKKSYAATMRLWQATEFRNVPILTQEPLMAETRFRNGSQYSISTASEHAARGPHPCALFIDECDGVSKTTFDAAMMQPQSATFPASWHIASTMFRVSGLMSELIANAEVTGFKVFTWCILEACQACIGHNCESCIVKEYCHSSLKDAIDIAYIDQLTLGYIDEVEEPILGYLHFDKDVIQRVVNAETVDDRHRMKPLDVASELFCQKVSKEGMVYSDFVAEAQIKDMKLITDPARITDEMEVGDFVLAEWAHYRSLDPGVANPYAVIKVARDPERRLYVYDEVYLRGRTANDIGIMLLCDDQKYDMTVCDVAAKQDRQILQSDFGIRCYSNQVSINDGISLVKQQMKQRSDGTYGLYVNANCSNFIYEITKGYKYPDDSQSDNPIDKDNHAMAALAYLVYALKLGKVRQSKGVYGYARKDD